MAIRKLFSNSKTDLTPKQQHGHCHEKQHSGIASLIR